MRRPFKLEPTVYLQVLNKEIQRFNEKYSSEIQEEMYYLPETADIQTVTRAIDDFDYLVHNYDPQSDDLIADYLEVRETLVGFRLALYAEMFDASLDESDSLQ